MTGDPPQRADAPRPCAVAILDGDRFLGSGFHLTPTTVLTAAHVARRTGPRSTVHARGGVAAVAGPARLFPDDPGPGRFHAFPDLALLTVGPPVAGPAASDPSAFDAWHPGPYGTGPAAARPLLDAGPPPAPGTSVLVSGFSPHTPTAGPQPDTLLLTVAGPAAGYLRVTGDEVREGLSGSMVVRLDTGAVCGVLKGSRDFDDVRGGWYTPLSALAAALPADDPLRRLLTAGREPAPDLPGAPPGAPPAAAVAVVAFPATRELLPLLLEVPDVDDPDLRRRVLREAAARLGPYGPLRAAHHPHAVDHLVEIVDACRGHRYPADALAAVVDAIDLLRPGSAADRLRAAVGRSGGGPTVAGR